jgi:hypothetical protein
VFLFYCVFGQAVIILYQLAKLSHSLNWNKWLLLFKDEFLISIWVKCERD